MNVNEKIVSTWWMLKLGYAFLFLAAGIDKFFNMIVVWGMYLNPKVLTIFPLGLNQFMMCVGVIEVAIGLMIATKLTKSGAYLGALWFGLIILNLLSTFKYYDIVARDLIILLGAIALANLTDVKDTMTK